MAENGNQQRFCSACGGDLSQRGEFCPGCARAVDSSKSFCSACGQDFDKRGAYCPHCGKQLKGEPVSKSAQAQVGSKLATPNNTKQGKGSMKRKACAGIVIAAMLALASVGGCYVMGIGPWSNDGVYVISKATYPKQQVVIENTLDDAGNATTSTLNYLGEMCNGYYRASFSCERTYDENGVLLSQKGDDPASVDSAGFTTDFRQGWSGKLGTYKVGAFQKDERNCLTSITTSYEPDYDDTIGVDGRTGISVYANESAENYSYRDDRVPKAISGDWSGKLVTFSEGWDSDSPETGASGDWTKEYDENGRLVAYEWEQVSNGSWREERKSFEYSVDEEQKKLTVSVSWNGKANDDWYNYCSNYSDGEASDSYTLILDYDDKGLVTSVTRDSEVVTEYEYKYVAHPSLMVRLKACTNDVQVGVAGL